MEEKNKRKVLLLVGVLVLLLLAAGVAIYSHGSTLPVPTNVKAVQQGVSVRLTWDDMGVYGYNVYRSLKPGDLGIKINTNPVPDNFYVDKHVDEGKTYYYIIRSTDEKGNEDPNFNQVSIHINPIKPSDLSILINNDAKYTNNKNVVLNLEASNADQCRYNNNGGTWSDWEPFTYMKQWQLTDKEGEVKVNYQCKRDISTGEALSDVVYDTIIADYTPPAVMISEVLLDNNTGNASMNIDATDNIDDNGLDCFVSLNGHHIYEFSSLNPNQEFSIPSGTYLLSIGCTDDAGNTGYAVLPVDGFVNPYDTNITNTSSSLTLLINDGDENTCIDNEEINVELTILGEGFDECRFADDSAVSNNNIDWETDWEPYSMHRNWQIEPTSSGTREVYVECRGNGKDEIAYDSINVLDESDSSCSSDSNNYCVCGDGVCNVNCEDDSSCPQDCSSDNLQLGLYGFRTLYEVLSSENAFTDDVNEEGVNTKENEVVSKKAVYIESNLLGVHYKIVDGTNTINLQGNTYMFPYPGKRDLTIQAFDNGDNMLKQYTTTITYDVELPSLQITSHEVNDDVWAYDISLTDNVNKNGQWLAIYDCTDNGCTLFKKYNPVSMNSILHGMYICKPSNVRHMFKVFAVDYAGTGIIESSLGLGNCAPQHTLNVEVESGCCGKSGTGYTNTGAIKLKVGSDRLGKIVDCNVGYRGDDGNIVFSPKPFVVDELGYFDYILPDSFKNSEVKLHVKCEDEEGNTAENIVQVVYDVQNPNVKDSSFTYSNDEYKANYEMNELGCFKNVQYQKALPSDEWTEDCKGSTPDTKPSCWTPLAYADVPDEVCSHTSTTLDCRYNVPESTMCLKLKFKFNDYACNELEQESDWKCVYGEINQPVCGDGVCDSEENYNICPEDCPNPNANIDFNILEQCVNTRTIHYSVSSNGYSSCTIGELQSTTTSNIVNEEETQTNCNNCEYTFRQGSDRNVILALECLDQNSNSETVYDSVKYDTTAPSISSFTASASAYSPTLNGGLPSACDELSNCYTVRLDWEASDANNLHYQLYRKSLSSSTVQEEGQTTLSDGSVLIADNLHTTQYTDYVKGGEYVYTLLAIDCAGNVKDKQVDVSAPPTPVQNDCDSDSTLPEITYTSEPEPDYTNTPVADVYDEAPDTVDLTYQQTVSDHNNSMQGGYVDYYLDNVLKLHKDCVDDSPDCSYTVTLTFEKKANLGYGMYYDKQGCWALYDAGSAYVKAKDHCGNEGIIYPPSDAAVALKIAHCCGDGVCDENYGESYSTCPMDCQPPPDPCNHNGVCEVCAGEDMTNCPDCNVNQCSNEAFGFDSAPVIVSSTQPSDQDCINQLGLDGSLYDGHNEEVGCAFVQPILLEQNFGGTNCNVYFCAFGHNKLNCDQDSCWCTDDVAYTSDVSSNSVCGSN